MPRSLALAALLWAVVCAVALAEERTRADVDRTVRSLDPEDASLAWARRRRAVPSEQGWNFAVRAAWLHQFPASVDGGGRMEVDRLLLRFGVGYSPRPEIPLSVSFGYRYDGYRFDGGTAFPSAPWGDIHSLRASIPLGFPLGKRWLFFALPTVRTTVEDGARLEDGITWGVLGGVVYRLNDRLTLGPGLGVLGEIEDDTSIFPVLLIEWRIRPNLLLKTGEGLGATQGPGLFLEWMAAPCWTFSIGGRFDRNRFRLDDHGVAPGGVGQETAYALLLAATWTPRENVDVFGSLGASFFGNLRLEDEGGAWLQDEDYDPVPFVGLGASIRF